MKAEIWLILNVWRIDLVSLQIVLVKRELGLKSASLLHFCSSLKKKSSFKKKILQHGITIHTYVIAAKVPECELQSQKLFEYLEFT